MHHIVEKTDFLQVPYHVKGIVTLQVEVDMTVEIDHFKRDPTQPTRDLGLQLQQKLLDAAFEKVAMRNCQAKINEILITK